MNTKTAIILAVAFAAVAAVSVKSQQQPQRQQAKHDVVVLQANPFQWIMSVGETDGMRDYAYQWRGFSVYNYDASEGAPKMYLATTTNYSSYITTNQLAQTLADLQDQGFNVTYQNGTLLTLMRVR